MKMFSQKSILFFSALLILSCPAVTASAGEDMDSASGFLCGYAMELYKQGSINDAIYQLKNALAINPADLTARKYLDRILHGQQQPLPKKQLSPKTKKPKQDARVSDARKKQLDGWLDRVQQDKATNELRQSLQDKEGRIESLNSRLIQDKESQIKSLNNQLTKTQQEKDVLLNRDNEQSRLLQEMQAQKNTIVSQKEELSHSVMDREKQLKQMNSQLDSLKAEIKSKDNKLKKLEDDLETEKGNFTARQQEMSLLVQDKQGQLEQLKRQMAQMEKERRSYEEQLEKLKLSVSEYTTELERKDADINQARLDYENRLLAVGGELKAKELMIQQLKDDKAAMLEQGQQEKQRRIARVEKLMKEIEDIYPDKQELKKPRPEVSREDIAVKNRQLDRIDELMQEIKEILPKAEAPL